MKPPVLLAVKLFLVVVSLVTMTALFPKKAGYSLAHFNGESPAVGALAPSFVLKNLDGKKVELRHLRGKPVVLQLGSHTCPVYRFRRWSMSSLYRKYKGKVHFLLVYTIEAHPKGSKSPYANKEWRTMWNVVGGIKVPQAETYQQRFNQANISVATLNIPYQMVVDTMENNVWRRYGRASSPAFVIDQQGKIALKQPWVYPKDIARTLDKLLAGRAAAKD